MFKRAYHERAAACVPFFKILLKYQFFPEMLNRMSEVLTITKMRSFKTRGIFSVGGGGGGGGGVLIKRTIEEASTSIMAYCLKASVPQVTI